MQQSERSQLGKLPLSRRLYKASKSKRLMLAVVIGLVLLAAAIWYWYDKQPIIDRDTISSADFTVYVPSKAPAGYTLREEQTSLSNGILTYGFQDESSDSDIIVTVQTKPSGFDMSQLSKDGSITSSSTSVGQLYNLSVGNSSQYLLDTGDSLLYITSPNNIDTSTVNSLANSLSKYD